jgi:hypothetical protein
VGSLLAPNGLGPNEWARNEGYSSIFHTVLLFNRRSVIHNFIAKSSDSSTKYLGWAKQLQWHGTSLVGGESYHTYAMSFSDDIILLIRLELLCW